VPKTRQITRPLLTRPDHLQPGQQAQLAGIRARCPHLDSLASHGSAFAEMMANLTGAADLDAWLAAVEAGDQPELHSFATSIRNDKEAVTNRLTLPGNSGRVEGTVNKAKIIKRQLYGRAGFALLRRRAMMHPALPAPQNSRKSQITWLRPGDSGSRTAGTARALVRPGGRPGRRVTIGPGKAGQAGSCLLVFQAG
jgi:hypothetical protein